MKSRKKGILLSYINTLLTLVVGIFLSSFYIKQLGNTEYGIYESISSFINYLVLLEFGTGTAITRNLSLCFTMNKDKEDIQKNISTIFGITIVLSIAIIIVALIFYFFIDKIYYVTMTFAQIAYAKKIFLFMLFYLISSYYVQTMSGIILAYENYTYASKISIVKTIIKLLLIACLILVTKKAIYIAIVDMIISIIVLIYTYYYCKKKYNTKFTIKYFDKKILKATLPLCLAVFIQVIVNQANNNVDKFVISIMISPEMVTLYSIALYIYSIFSTATTIPITIYSPQIIREVALGKQKKELVDILIQPSRLIVIIGGLLLFGFIAVGKQFIIIMYGKEYIKAWIISMIIMIPMFFNMSNGIIINVLDALNKRMVRSMALLITTILNIILTVIWVKQWGIIGAASATLLCTILGQILIMNIYYYKKLKLPIIYIFKKTFKGILSFQLIAMIVAYLIANCISNVYISFFIGGVLYISIFGILYFLFGKNNIESKYIDDFITKIKLKRVNYEKNNR